MYALKILLNFSITEFLAKVRFEVKLILIMNVFQMFLFGWKGLMQMISRNPLFVQYPNNITK